MKNTVFWDVAPCRSLVNRRFGGTHRRQAAAACSRGFLACGFPALKMEEIRSSETSVHTKPLRRHIPEDLSLVSVSDLFNDAVSSSYCVVSIACNLLLGTILEFAWRN
jgi:hypothetical protein